MPWLIGFPAAFLVLLLLGLLFVGDGLRDAFDPKDR
jgi:oligopeptide transport system permease protein